MASYSSNNNDVCELASKIGEVQDIESRSNCTSITQLNELETDPANPKVSISLYYDFSTIWKSNQ